MKLTLAPPHCMSESAAISKLPSKVKRILHSGTNAGHPHRLVDFADISARRAALPAMG